MDDLPVKEDILIATLFDKKKDFFFKKMYKLKGVNPLHVKNISEVEKLDVFGLIIDYENFKYYRKQLVEFKKNVFFKLFLVLTEKEIKSYFIENIKYVSYYTVIPAGLQFKKIQIIIDKFIEESNLYLDKIKLEKSIKEKNIDFETLNHIGTSLSAIKDIDTLLDLILTKSREITNADAGSVYLVEETVIKEEEEKRITDRVLRFMHSQNFSFPINTSTFTMPLTKKSIVGYSALTGKILNLTDAHKISAGSDYSYSIEMEEKLKVHNRSIVIVPMKNQKDEIIGVIELFNKKKNFDINIKNDKVFDEQVIPFTKEDEAIVMSLASQAAVSLENNILYKEIKNIFEGFIRASVVAIEARDPTTSGHSERVALLTKQLAISVKNTKTGVYAGINFSDEEIKVIEYAGLLHDFGKIGVREKVLVKAKKLYPEELEVIKWRFNNIKRTIQYDYAMKKLDLIKNEGLEYFKSVEKVLDKEMTKKLDELKYFLDTILQANEPTILAENCEKILSGLIGKKYSASDGEEVDYLEEEEKESLIVLKGSLTDEQRKEIESHVTHSFKFLCNIPWTKEMASIPHIAYKHHEKLDGSGYPRSIKGQNIPIQARMMTIADIYDALTASDRPYKRAVTNEKALKIIQMEVDDGKLDKELARIFLEDKVFRIIEKP
jgi:HD-GYP domain-containing protein (c-di-GMP phosphodiesterase class II)